MVRASNPMASPSSSSNSSSCFSSPPSSVGSGEGADRDSCGESGELTAPATATATGNPKMLAAKMRAGPTIDKRKRLAANARERKRMNLLNKAYDQLRRRLNDAENKSKYDVLVQAKEYIRALASICADFDRANPDHPLVAGAAKRNVAPAVQANAVQPLELARGALEACNQKRTVQAARPAEQEQRRPRDHLTVATVARLPVVPYQRPIESPGGSSDCLSPMSLPDSIASMSSTGSHCSSGNQFYPFPAHQQQQQQHQHHHHHRHQDHIQDNHRHQQLQRDQQLQQSAPQQLPLAHYYQAHNHYHATTAAAAAAAAAEHQQKTVLLLQTSRIIKQEPMDELPDEYHRRMIYHKHYQSFFTHIPKQASL